MAEIEARIREFVVGEFAPDGDIDLDAGTNLLEEEVVDSLGIFTLISFIESEFAVSIETDEVTLENFETLSRIAKLVESKIA